MSERGATKKQAFMDWLQELVDSSPEAATAARDEEVQLNLSEALRSAREAAGMTQRHVAETSGLKQSAVSRLEKPGHNATVGTVLTYLHAVGADLVLSVVVEGRTFPATAMAKRAVVMPTYVCDWADTHGMDLREHVLASVTRQETVTEVASIFRSEVYKQLSEMRRWIGGQRKPRLHTGDFLVNYGSRVAHEEVDYVNLVRP